ncbi:hypothetical protein ACOMHN_024914 [Nucella lapillus]
MSMENIADDEDHDGELNFTELLGRTLDGQAISILRGEQARLARDSRPHPCPHTLTHDLRAPLARRQLCPHYYNVLELPHGYFPPVLRMAVCQCRHCIEHTKYRCQPQHSSVRVLKPVGCFFGMQRYVQGVIDHIPVSCACAV